MHGLIARNSDLHPQPAFQMELLKRVYRSILPRAVRKPIREWRFEREFHPDAEVEFYGAYDLLLKHIGERRLPYQYRRLINWQHGWIPDFFHHGSDEPFDILQNFTWSNPDYFNLVPRKVQENRLRELGRPNSLAIGLPIVYFPRKKRARSNGALLVMPGHSLDYISQQTMEDDYISYINGIRDQFSRVTVCIHPSCLRNGYWINSFRKHGYRIITGVEINDSRAFEKLQDYFSEHEFCTTNKWGSHLIYTALFGCKVSIMGPEPIFSFRDLERSSHWRDNADKRALNKSYELTFNSVFRIHYPGFFVEHPKAAVRNEELARYECGDDNRINRAQYREIVEWVTRRPGSLDQ